MKMVNIPFLILLTLLLPSLVFSDELQEGNTLWYYWQKDPSLEIVNLRTPNTKVFLNEDGHLTYRVYLQPVHYIDEAGFLRDIEPVCISDPRDMDFRGYADDLFGDVVTNDHIWTHEDGFWRGFAKFNTSAIPDTTVVDSVKLSLYALNCWGVWFGGTHDMRSMESNPQYSDGYSIYADAGNGDFYLDDFDPDPDVLYTWILGDEQTDPACVQMTNQLPADWFAIGMSDYGGGAWYSNAMGYDRGIGYVEIEEPPTAVNLVSFTASPDVDQVNLMWRTEYEVDNLKWLLERKTEEGDYEVISIIPGQLTKPGPTDYAYNDTEILSGDAYYYRLINVNTQGERTYHNPIFVTIPTVAGKKLSAFPSIFSQKLSIRIIGVYHKSGILSIVDATGRVVQEIAISGSTSPLSIEWDGTDSNGRSVKGGVYFIHLATNGAKPETSKVVLIR
jgi:hypothetical protein